MSRTTWIRWLVLAGGAWLALAHVARAQLLDEEGFVMAAPGRPVELPADHGSHPETRTEWWYLTGWLEDGDGRPFGFQATWFRRALQLERPAGRSPLAVRDVLLFHGVVLDVDAQEHHVGEQAARAYPPWASARSDGLDVRLLGHQLVDEEGAGERARLTFGAAGAQLELDLDLVAHPPLRHGREPGLSIKGSRPGEASWYYSLPRIAARGTLQLPDGTSRPVSGQAWFDHEFGSMALGAEQVGWDWFSVALDDGTDLMVYVLRRADGRADAPSSGTLRDPDGNRHHLPRESFSVTPTGSWTSPRSGARYPAGWTLTAPEHQLELTVTPLVADQELATPRTTGVTYWEGLCRFTGTRAGRRVGGRGYVELVGYDRPISARFAPRGD